MKIILRVKDSEIASSDRRVSLKLEMNASTESDQFYAFGSIVESKQAFS